MSGPVTTNNAPTALKQGVKAKEQPGPMPMKVMPAKHATAHRIANAHAAAANKRTK